MFGWLKGLLRGRREGSGSSRVRSRVQVGSINQFPEHVLRDLRLLDDTLDGFILPDGRVWLLQLEPGKPRIYEGRKALANARAEGFDEPMFAEQLMAQGFCRLAEEPFHLGTSAGYMTKIAQRAIYATREEIEQTMLLRRAEADGTMQAVHMHQVLSDRIRSSAKGDWARTYRGRRTFGYAH